MVRIGLTDALKALVRHVTGDWGELSDADRKANEAALKDGSRLMSVYWTAEDIKFWIITEADRRLTNVDIHISVGSMLSLQKC